MYEKLQLTDNKASHSFEMMIDGQRAFIDYRLHGDIVLLVHTEVPKDLEGRGIATALVEKTFNYLRDNQIKIKVYCAYILFYLKKHPEWNVLLAP